MASERVETKEERRARKELKKKRKAEKAEKTEKDDSQPKSKKQKTRSSDENKLTINSPVLGASKPPTEKASPSSEEYLKTHQVRVINGEEKVTAWAEFADTPFAHQIMHSISALGFERPSPVQAISWPLALAGRNLISVAKTGSGKTCGFLLPIFHRLLCKPRSPMERRNGPMAVVLAPTRELAVQIHEEAARFTGRCGVRSVSVFGGTPKFPQIKQLQQGVDLCVATPGRLNDLMEMGRASMGVVQYLVLDEADRMLDMGFLPQIETVVSAMPAARQSLLFTATWPREVQALAHKLVPNAAHITLGSAELSANSSITQNILMTSQSEKLTELQKLLKEVHEGEGHEKTILFVSQKRTCDELANQLWEQGYAVDCLHGDRTQWERTKVTNQFRSGELRLLVATDVAGRGLDVKDVGIVINYDFPMGMQGVEDYVHRIGRTGRAGAEGTAYTLFTHDDRRSARALVGVLNKSNQTVPDELAAMAQSRGGGGGAFGGGRGRGGRGRFGGGRGRGGGGRRW